MEMFKKVIGYVVGFAVAYFLVSFLFSRDKLKPFAMFRCDEGSFSVLFPGEPERGVQSLNTQAGKINLVMYNAGSKKSGFVVGYADYPEKIVRESDPNKMLDGARDGAVGNVGGELIDEMVLDSYGYPARELEINVPRKATVRARLVLVGNRLYQIMVVSKSKAVLEDKGTEFFDSFKIDE